MNKRIARKYLTERERLVLALYKKCEDVTFYRYKASKSSGLDFAKMASEPYIDDLSSEFDPLLAIKGRIDNITVTSFVREWGEECE